MTKVNPRHRVVFAPSYHMLLEYILWGAAACIVVWACGCIRLTGNRQSVTTDVYGNLNMAWNDGQLHWKYGRSKPIVHGKATVVTVGNMAHISTGNIFQNQSVNYQFKD